MGKDVEACCDTCKLFGDSPPAVVPDAPPLRANHADIRIVVMQRGTELATVRPTSSVVHVGRTQGNDVVLPSGSISKRQCVITFRDGDVIVEDRRSTCGTVVGGRKIFVPTKLPDDGLIHVGDYLLRITRG